VPARGGSTLCDELARHAEGVYQLREKHEVPLLGGHLG
jgi:hypothetical protein